MNKFSYSAYDSSNTDIAFSQTNGYSDPSTEEETRKQLSYPLKELKTYINNTVSVNSAGNAIQLAIVNGRLKYRTEENGTLTNVPACLPAGGTSGQLLKKSSSMDGVAEWGIAIYSGTTEPSADLGNDGDIYFLYEE